MRADRRFFQTRLRELIAQGFIEKVQVPNPGGRLIPCIRLLCPDEAPQSSHVPSVVEIPESAYDFQSRIEPCSHDIDEDEKQTLKTNVSLQKQMIDLIHQSGTEGATLNVGTDSRER